MEEFMGNVLLSIFLSPLAVIIFALAVKKKLKQDPERAKNYKTFGILSLVSSVLLVALAFPVIWLTVHLFQWTFSYLGIFTKVILVGNLVLGLLTIEVPIIYFAILIATIILPICQIAINGHVIGWISLVVSIVAIIGTIILCSSLILNGVVNDVILGS